MCSVEKRGKTGNYSKLMSIFARNIHIVQRFFIRSFCRKRHYKIKDLHVKRSLIFKEEHVLLSKKGKYETNIEGKTVQSNKPDG